MTNLEETCTCGSIFFKYLERFLQSIYSNFYNTNENEDVFDDVDISLNDDIHSVRMDLSNTLSNINH